MKYLLFFLALPAFAQITINGQPCNNCTVAITTTAPPVTPPRDSSSYAACNSPNHPPRWR